MELLSSCPRTGTDSTSLTLLTQLVCSRVSRVKSEAILWQTWSGQHLLSSFSTGIYRARLLRLYSQNSSVSRSLWTSSSCPLPTATPNWTSCAQLVQSSPSGTALPMTVATPWVPTRWCSPFFTSLSAITDTGCPPSASPPSTFYTMDRPHSVDPSLALPVHWCSSEWKIYMTFYRVYIFPRFWMKAHPEFI